MSDKNADAFSVQAGRRGAWGDRGGDKVWKSAPLVTQFTAELREMQDAGCVSEGRRDVA